LSVRPEIEGQAELEVRLVAMRSRGCALGAAGCAGASLWSLEQSARKPHPLV
jgi:hypothetical protein